MLFLPCPVVVRGNPGAPTSPGTWLFCDTGPMRAVARTYTRLGRYGLPSGLLGVCHPLHHTLPGDTTLVTRHRPFIHECLGRRACVLRWLPQGSMFHGKTPSRGAPRPLLLRSSAAAALAA